MMPRAPSYHRGYPMMDSSAGARILDINPREILGTATDTSGIDGGCAAGFWELFEKTFQIFFYSHKKEKILPFVANCKKKCQFG